MVSFCRIESGESVLIPWRLLRSVLPSNLPGDKAFGNIPGLQIEMAIDGADLARHVETGDWFLHGRIGILNELFYGRSHIAGPAELSIPFPLDEKPRRTERRLRVLICGGEAQSVR
jgi:hypothetical protein